MLGATEDDQSRWHAPPGSPVPDRHRAILTAAGGGQDLTRQDMIDILTDAGYTSTSAAGLIATTHPLFTRAGPNRYRILGTPPRYLVRRRPDVNCEDYRRPGIDDECGCSPVT